MKKHKYGRPDPLLERLTLGEVPAHLEERIRRLQDDPATAERIEQLRRDDARILEELPPAEMTRRIQGQLRSEKAHEALAQKKRWWLPAPGLAVGALVLALGLGFAPRFLATGEPVVAVAESGSAPSQASEIPAMVVPPLAVSPSTSDPTRPESPSVMPVTEGIRFKGDTVTLHIHRLRFGPDSVSETLHEGDSTAAGDLLQIAVGSRAEVHLLVVSMDGRGTVTRHLPEEGDMPVRLEAGETRRAPHAYQLDDAPDHERFLVLWSLRPFDLKSVLRHLEIQARDSATPRIPSGLPASLHVQSLLLPKVAP